MPATLEELQTAKQRRFALAFIRSKGRMPENEIEFCDWLLEFDAELWNALGMALDRFDLHMQTCQKALELHKGRVS